MKKFTTTLVATIMVAMFALVLVGCGIGQAPEQDQLVGRWNLTRIETGGLPREQSDLRVQEPGSSFWASGYFIEFDADGNFSEIDFWNWRGTTVISSGTFALDGNDLTLTRTGGVAAGTMPYRFVGDRRVGISSDGNTLTMTYTRTQTILGQQARWDYTLTFERAA